MTIPGIMAWFMTIETLRELWGVCPWSGRSLLFRTFTTEMPRFVAVVADGWGGGTRANPSSTFGLEKTQRHHLLHLLAKGRHPSLDLH
jgi:hypothetical protein